jgi:hypothetical protein
MVRRVAMLAIVAFGLVGCASDKAQATVKTAAGYPKPNSTLSVLGVYSAGRMSPEAWREWGPFAATAFGPGCDPGFSNGLQTTGPRWFSLIDQTTRDDGVTEDLIHQIAPSARGNTIVLIEEEFDEPTEEAPTRSPSPAPSQGGGRGGGRGRSGGRHSSGSSPARPKTHAGLYAVEALAFAADNGALVVDISAEGTYKDREKTVRMFVDQLRTTFSGSSCTGWHWETEGP